MNITLELTGTMPMLMHNIALADPDNPIVAEISTFTSKRKKTEDDRRAIERLEWFGGLARRRADPGPARLQPGDPRTARQPRNAPRLSTP